MPSETDILLLDGSLKKSHRKGIKRQVAIIDDEVIQYISTGHKAKYDTRRSNRSSARQGKVKSRALTLSILIAVAHALRKHVVTLFVLSLIQDSVRRLIFNVK